MAIRAQWICRVVQSFDHNRCLYELGKPLLLTPQDLPGFPLGLTSLDEFAYMGPWEFGGEVRMLTGEYAQAPMVTSCPVEKDEDIYNLQWPRPDSGFSSFVRKFFQPCPSGETRPRAL